MFAEERDHEGDGEEREGGGGGAEDQPVARGVGERRGEADREHGEDDQREEPEIVAAREPPDAAGEGGEEGAAEPVARGALVAREDVAAEAVEAQQEVEHWTGGPGEIDEGVEQTEERPEHPAEGGLGGGDAAHEAAAEKDADDKRPLEFRAQAAHPEEVGEHAAVEGVAGLEGFEHALARVFKIRFEAESFAEVLLGFFRVVAMETVPALVRVGKGVVGGAVEREIDRGGGFLFAAEPHEGHGAEVGGVDVLGVEREGLLGGGEGGGPVAPCELDGGEEREVVLDGGIEAKGFVDGGARGLVAVGAVEREGVDVVEVGAVGGEAEGGLGGGEGFGAFALFAAAEGKDGEGGRIVGLFGERQHDLALGLGGTGLREEELGAGEVGAHAGRRRAES